jgi:hypothetical protein
MRQIVGCLAVAAAAGCTNSAPSDPVVGTGSVARNGTSLGVMAVRAVADYAFFGSGNDSYGGYAIMFSTQGAGLRCSEVAALPSVAQLDISTPQVFTPASAGRAVLSIGEIPVVLRDPFDDGPPAMTIAELYASQPPMTAGKVTITAFDDESIAGTFTATGPDSHSTPTSVTTLSGSFDAAICPH